MENGKKIEFRGKNEPKLLFNADLASGQNPWTHRNQRWRTNRGNVTWVQTVNFRVMSAAEGRTCARFTRLPLFWFFTQSSLKYDWKSPPHFSHYFLQGSAHSSGISCSVVMVRMCWLYFIIQTQSHRETELLLCNKLILPSYIKSIKYTQYITQLYSTYYILKVKHQSSWYSHHRANSLLQHTGSSWS